MAPFWSRDKIEKFLIKGCRYCSQFNGSPYTISFCKKQDKWGYNLAGKKYDAIINTLLLSFCDLFVFPVLALSQGAMIGPVNSGTLRLERSFTPWRATGMWFMP